MKLLKIINIYNYSIYKDIANVTGNQATLLFGFILIKNKKINFDVCLSDVEFIQFKNMCSLCDAIEYVVNEKCHPFLI